MTQLHELGYQRDKKRRTDLARRDDTEFRTNVTNARKAIYEEGFGITSTTVETLLKPKSLVPTEVQFRYIHLVLD